jgi:hypothetical protein
MYDGPCASPDKIRAERRPEQLNRLIACAVAWRDLAHAQALQLRDHGPDLLHALVCQVKTAHDQVDVALHLGPSHDLGNARKRASGGAITGCNKFCAIAFFLFYLQLNQPRPPPRKPRASPSLGAGLAYPGASEPAQ